MKDPDGRLSERKKMILRAIVEAHIDKGEPVGSKYLTQSNDIALSPATVRNEMAELEEMGYLEQPHTSAGRVPSELGYRFYVDSLMNSYRLTKDELDELNGIVKVKEAELDKIIEQAGKLFSHVTNYTAITVRPRPQNVKVKRFSTVPVDINSYVLVVVTDSGQAATKLIRTPCDLSALIVGRLADVLNSSLTGVSVNDLPYSEIAKMKARMGDYGLLIDPVVKFVHDTLAEIDKGDVRIEGVNRLLDYPEYADVKELQNLIGSLESKDELIDLISNSEKDRINILIGKENAVDTMNKSSIIFKTITSNGKVIGAIGVIGPRRMDYSKVVTTLDTLSQKVKELFRHTTPRLSDGKSNTGKDEKNGG